MRYEIRLKFSTDSRPPLPLSSPAFLKAMKTNFSLSRIHFPDQDMEEQLRAICRLNVSGRGYMQEDASNKVEGYHVLKQVNDDLDCIFYYLCESPLITAGRRSPSNTTRKRKVEDSLSRTKPDQI